MCRVYQQCVTPEYVENMQELPQERKPSAVYLKTMILGARESGLPEDYQEFIQSIPHNGYDGEVDLELG